MLVIRERISMFTLSKPLLNKTAEETTKATIELFKDLPGKIVNSLTYDNGGEFYGHSDVQKALGVQTYFCDPYASWQKGGIENTNGRLRRDFPRSTDLKSMKREEFDEAIENYNNTPRKNLDWFTPYEVFSQKSCVALQM